RADLPVLARAALALVAVDAQVDGRGALLRQEAPLHAGREAGAAAAAQVRRFHHLDQLLGRVAAERLPHGLVTAVLQVHVQPAEAGDVPAAEQEVLGHRADLARGDGPGKLLLG